MIKGLLKGLSVAYTDKNTALFDRIKTVLAMIARPGSSTAGEKTNSGDQCKILMTELTSMLLKPHKDSGLHKTYQDSFLHLSKFFWDDEDQREFLSSTFRDLLKRFLQGRCAVGSALSLKFW